MAFKVGDKVKVLNDPIEGIITKVKGSIAYVESDGFEYPFPLEELLSIDQQNNITFKSSNKKVKINQGRQEEYQTLSGKATSFIPKKNAFGVVEVDLHVQAIIDEYPDITRENALQYQLRHAKTSLTWAQHKNHRRIVFIHGVGEGVLKNHLVELFEQGYNLEIAEASYKLYGFGAMEVFLK